jgi:hypothetical protein
MAHLETLIAFFVEGRNSRMPHVGNLASIDVFTVHSATFRVLFVLLVLSHDRRRIVHFSVTANPNAAWTAQQIVQVWSAPAAQDGFFGRDSAPGASSFLENTPAMVGFSRFIGSKGRRRAHRIAASKRRKGRCEGRPPSPSDAISCRCTRDEHSPILQHGHSGSPAAPAQPSRMSHPISAALIAACSARPGSTPSTITSSAANTSATATCPDFIGFATGAPGSGSRKYMVTSTRR